MCGERPVNLYIVPLNLVQNFVAEDRNGIYLPIALDNRNNLRHCPLSLLQKA